jgi:hypothetical protein
MIIFIGCVKTKQHKICAAKDMYISTLFRYSLQYAKTLTNPDKIFILSAKYGVLRLQDIIAPYELCLNDMTVQQCKKWANKCIQQMKDQNINFNEKAVFLCGEKYRKYIINHFPKSHIPLKNLSFGKQLKFYKEQISKNEKNRKKSDFTE